MTDRKTIKQTLKREFGAHAAEKSGGHFGSWHGWIWKLKCCPWGSISFCFLPLSPVCRLQDKIYLLQSMLTSSRKESILSLLWSLISHFIQSNGVLWLARQGSSATLVARGRVLSKRSQVRASGQPKGGLLRCIIPTQPSTNAGWECSRNHGNIVLCVLPGLVSRQLKKKKKKDATSSKILCT